jgi:hypothetical protein
MKSRNREINIFNMSLLDILCGALGAFCFLMLALLPYYRPPGEDYKKITEEQQKILEEVQDIKDLAERLKNTTNVEDLRDLVEQLKKQILVLENQIKKLQGQLNALFAENTQLKERIDDLEKEKEDLLARLEMARMEKERLEMEKMQLEQEKQKLERQLYNKNAWVVAVNAADPGQYVYCGLVEMKHSGNDGKRRQPDFDPSQRSFPPFWPGDYTFQLGNHTLFMDQYRVPGGEQRLYVSYASEPEYRRATDVKTTVTGNEIPLILVPTVRLTPERYWTWIGTFAFDDTRTLIFTPATEAQREAEWKRLTKVEPPKPPPPSPVPGPKLTQEQIEERRQRLDLIRKEALRRAMEGLPDAARERVTKYAAALDAAKDEGERAVLFAQAMDKAEGGQEHSVVIELFQGSLRRPRMPASTSPVSPPIRSSGSPPAPASPGAGPAVPFGISPSPASPPSARPSSTPK